MAAPESRRYDLYQSARLETHGGIPKRAKLRIYVANSKGCSSWVQRLLGRSPTKPCTTCLAKDRDVLLAFYDFPAEHRKHIRTTNPIESTFATVRLRITKTKGCLSRMTALTMVFKLLQSASKKWRRLDGSHQLAEIIQGVKFKDGEKLIERAA